MGAVAFESDLCLSPVRSDVHKLCLVAKGLREGVCVRCLDTYREGDTMVVMYSLRVEDVESGRSWVVAKRYRDFAALQQQLGQLWPPIASFPFPRKHIVKTQSHVIEERVESLEAFLRRCAATLTAHAVLDGRAAPALCRLYDFLNLPVNIPETRAAAQEEQQRQRQSSTAASAPVEHPVPLTRLSEGKALEVAVFELLSEPAASLVPSVMVADDDDAAAAAAAAASDRSGDARTWTSSANGTGQSSKAKLTALVARESAALVHTFKANVLRDPAIVAASTSKDPRAHEEVLREVALRIAHLANFLLDNYRVAMTAVLDRWRRRRPSLSTASSSNFESSGGGGSSGSGSPAMRLARENLAVDEHARVLRKAARRQSEAALFVPLRRFLLATVVPLKRRSRRLQRRMEVLKRERLKTAAALQVDPRLTLLQPEWRHTLHAFRKLGDLILPCDLVDCLCKVCKCVFTLHAATERLAQMFQQQQQQQKGSAAAAQAAAAAAEEESGGAAPATSSASSASSASSSSSVSAMSADDFLPMFTFCMALAVPEDILAQAEFMSHLIDADEAVSEKGYYVASLQAAVNIAQNLEIDQGLGVVEDIAKGGGAFAAGGGGGEAGGGGKNGALRRLSSPRRA